mmetsp:Transcript_5967/g.17239  ORF Transcript_5967/g.17239 Transcript_5967/m.17239 type:complete len:340 (-) Transcript_5967:557-1576(-)
MPPEQVLALPEPAAPCARRPQTRHFSHNFAPEGAAGARTRPEASSMSKRKPMGTKPTSISPRSPGPKRPKTSSANDRAASKPRLVERCAPSATCREGASWRNAMRTCTTTLGKAPPATSRNGFSDVSLELRETLPLQAISETKSSGSNSSGSEAPATASSQAKTSPEPTSEKGALSSFWRFILAMERAVSRHLSVMLRDGSSGASRGGLGSRGAGSRGAGSRGVGVQGVGSRFASCVNSHFVSGIATGGRASTEATEPHSCKSQLPGPNIMEEAADAVIAACDVLGTAGRGIGAQTVCCVGAIMATTGSCCGVTDGVARCDATTGTALGGGTGPINVGM